MFSLLSPVEDERGALAPATVGLSNAPGFASVGNGYALIFW
jgi:hypothetical protein